MVDATVDKVLMLLSTDWFSPFWSAIGLNVDSAARSRVRSRLQELATTLMAGASSYWNISFEPSRLATTREELLGVFEECDVSERSMVSLRALIDRTSGVTAETDVAWLLSSITELLSNSDAVNPQGAISKQTIEIVIRLWRETEMKTPSFRDICLGSDTPWDVRVRSFTPDLPSWLADYVAVEIQSVDRFGLFWGLLFRALQSQELQTVRDWYQSTALELTGQRLT